MRLSLIPTQDLLKTVRPTNLVQPDILLDAIQARTEFRDMELKYRGYLSMFLPISRCLVSDRIYDIVTGWLNQFKIGWPQFSKLWPQIGCIDSALS